MPKLNDLYSSWSGLFSNMTGPDFLAGYQAADLDVEFFAKFGERPASPLVEHFITPQGNLSDLQKQRIAAILASKFRTQWDHKYAILSVEYNPIENYRMSETVEHKGSETEETAKTGTETDTLSKTGTETNAVNHTGSEKETTTYSGKETDTETLSGKEKTTGTGSNDYYGFNGAAASPVNESDTTSELEFTNRENKNEKTFTQRQDEIEKTFTNREDSATTSFDEREDTHTLEFNERKDTTTKSFENRKDETNRSGNIGVTTSQQMIQSEVDLWNWNFLDDVFRDVASVIACPLYEAGV